MHLLQRLLEQGVLTEADVTRLNEARAAAPTKAVHELIVEKGFAKEEPVLAALAEEFGMELVDLSNVTVDPETLKAMPLKLVHRRTLMPLERKNGTLIVATGDPYDDYFHGTYVGSIVTANNFVTAGVAPKVRLVAVKVLNSQGSGSSS